MVCCVVFFVEIVEVLFDEDYWDFVGVVVFDVVMLVVD